MEKLIQFAKKLSQEEKNLISEYCKLQKTIHWDLYVAMEENRFDKGNAINLFKNKYGNLINSMLPNSFFQSIKDLLDYVNENPEKVYPNSIQWDQGKDKIKWG